MKVKQSKKIKANPTPEEVAAISEQVRLKYESILINVVKTRTKKAQRIEEAEAKREAREEAKAKAKAEKEAEKEAKLKARFDKDALIEARAKVREERLAEVRAEKEAKAKAREERYELIEARKYIPLETKKESLTKLKETKVLIGEKALIERIKATPKITTPIVISSLTPRFTKPRKLKTEAELLEIEIANAEKEIAREEKKIAKAEREAKAEARREKRLKDKLDYEAKEKVKQEKKEARIKAFTDARDKANDKATVIFDENDSFIIDHHLTPRTIEVLRDYFILYKSKYIERRVFVNDLKDINLYKLIKLANFNTTLIVNFVKFLEHNNLPSTHEVENGKLKVKSILNNIESSSNPITEYPNPNTASGYKPMKREIIYPKGYTPPKRVIEIENSSSYRTIKEKLAIARANR